MCSPPFVSSCALCLMPALLGFFLASALLTLRGHDTTTPDILRDVCSKVWNLVVHGCYTLVAVNLRRGGTRMVRIGRPKRRIRVEPRPEPRREPEPRRSDPVREPASPKPRREKVPA